MISLKRRNLLRVRPCGDAGVSVALVGLALIVAMTAISVPAEAQLDAQTEERVSLTLEAALDAIAKTYDFDIHVSDFVDLQEKAIFLPQDWATSPTDAFTLIARSFGVELYFRTSTVYVHLALEEAEARYRTAEFAKFSPEGPGYPLTGLKFSDAKMMCGPNSLAILCQALGVPMEVEDLATFAGANEIDGTNMAGLVKAAKAVGLDAIPVKLSLDRYDSLNIPLIIHVDNGHGHFVVLSEKVEDGGYVVMDAPHRSSMNREDLEKIYTGHALIVRLPVGTGSAE